MRPRPAAPVGPRNPPRQWDPETRHARRPINAPPNDRSFGRYGVTVLQSLAFYNTD